MNDSLNVGADDPADTSSLQHDDSEATALQDASTEGWLPALLVFLVTIGIAVYGLGVQPERLNDRYATRLETQLASYQSMLEQSGDLNVELLHRKAVGIETLYRRLGDLSHSPVQIAHDRTRFFVRHVENIQRLTNSLSNESERMMLEQQRRDYLESIRQWCQRHSDNNEFAIRADARVWKAIDAVVSGLESQASIDQLRSSIRELLEQLEDERFVTAKGQRESKSEVRTKVAQRLVALLAVEDASAATRRQGITSPPSSDSAKTALDELDNLIKTWPVYDSDDLCIQTCQSLLWCFVDGNIATEVAQAVYPDAINYTKDDYPFLSLARAQRSAILGDWGAVREVAFSELKTPTVDSAFFRNELATWLVRIACSDLALKNPTWAGQCVDGLDLGLQLSPGNQELCELIWRLGCESGDDEVDAARSPAEVDFEGFRPSRLPPSVRKGIRASPRSPFRLASSAIKVARADDFGQVDEILETGQLVSARVGDILAQIGIWRMRSDQGDAPFWVRLLTRVCQSEPKNGFARLALAFAQSRDDDPAAAAASIELAREQLGDIPAIDNLRVLVERGSNPSAK